MKIAVRDLRPNPFRHLERYPLDPDKVDALVRSIKATEFWDNLLARKSGDTFELAYGHHRYAALKKAGVDEIDIPVRKLDDTTMVQIMALENMEEWGTNALVEQETIRSIVEALGEGRISLPACGKGAGWIRIAPSFTPVPKETSGRPEVFYSAATLAKFTKKPEGRIEAILNTLAAIEKGLVEQEAFEGLSTYQAEAVASQARRVEKETGDTGLAKAIGSRLGSGMRSATGRPPGRGGKTKAQHQAITLSQARGAADQMMASKRRKDAPKSYPSAGKAIPKLAGVIAELPSAAMVSKVQSVIEVRTEIHTKDRAMLVAALRGLAKRVTKLADKLEG